MRNKIAIFSIVAACIAALPSTLRASDTGEYVYVESNLKATNSNSVYAFKRGWNGQLTEIAGSPFLTGGAGTQYAGFDVGPQDSDQNIITNPEQTLLFAVNSGSDTIAVFHIKEGGSLKPVDGSPFASGGNDPVSLGLDRNTLFIVNKSGDPGRPSSLLPNYTTMRVAWDGKLSPIDNTVNESSRSFQTTVNAAIGSSPSQAFVVPGSDLLFGADFFGGLIQRFRYDQQGRLLQYAPLSLPADEFGDTTTPRLPLGLWNHPQQHILYVGFVTASKLGVYHYSSDGALKFIRAVPNSGKAICWIRTTRSGTRLYTTDTVSNSVTYYDNNDPEKPVEQQNLVLSEVGEVLQFSLSGDEKFIYALSSRGSASTPAGSGNVLHVVSVKDDGTLSETVPPVDFSLPEGVRPQGVAVVDQY